MKIYAIVRQTEHFTDVIYITDDRQKAIDKWEEFVEGDMKGHFGLHSIKGDKVEVGA